MSSGGSTVVRALLAGVGVATAAYGAWLLLTRQSGEQLVSAGQWLVAGVLLHDAVLAPLVLLIGVVASRFLPRAARGPAVVVGVVLGSLTLLAVPVLGGFGRRPDNPTLLGRDYTAGWLAVAALVLVGVALGAWVASVLRTRRGHGLRPRR